MLPSDDHFHFEPTAIVLARASAELETMMGSLANLERALRNDAAEPSRRLYEHLTTAQQAAEQLRRELSQLTAPQRPRCDVWRMLGRAISAARSTAPHSVRITPLHGCAGEVVGLEMDLVQAIGRLLLSSARVAALVGSDELRVRTRTASGWVSVFIELSGPLPLGTHLSVDSVAQRMLAAYDATARVERVGKEQERLRVELRIDSRDGSRTIEED